jgi:small-conductance mechanosensitive channel
MNELWPAWSREWLDLALPVVQMVLIVIAAWLLQRLARRVIRRLGEHNVPIEMTTGARRVSAFLIYGAAALLVLERLGVSAAVLWTAFTGFAAVAAVAFFAVWSVLSNIFCSVLIFTTRPFRLYETIELLENGETIGLKGRVMDINLIYTTLQEEGPEDGQTGHTLQIPNSLFFQRAVRRFRSNPARGTQGDG